jgi:hypothetical protein
VVREFTRNGGITALEVFLKENLDRWFVRTLVPRLLNANRGSLKRWKRILIFRLSYCLH